jgi:hypothetical protein
MSPTLVLSGIISGSKVRRSCALRIAETPIDHHGEGCFQPLIEVQSCVLCTVNSVRFRHSENISVPKEANKVLLYSKSFVPSTLQGCLLRNTKSGLINNHAGGSTLQTLPEFGPASVPPFASDDSHSDAIRYESKSRIDALQTSRR